jgi:hypothetical protein
LLLLLYLLCFETHLEWGAGLHATNHFLLRLQAAPFRLSSKYFLYCLCKSAKDVCFSFVSVLILGCRYGPYAVLYRDSLALLGLLEEKPSPQELAFLPPLVLLLVLTTLS